jgi:hypothetical protein
MWEVNLALFSEKIFLINNLNAMVPELVMDISFSEYSEYLPVDNITNARTVNSDPVKHQDISKFVLSRNHSKVEFLPLDLSDFFHWREAIQTYCIQRIDVWSVFKFTEILGQGSYGKVFLANYLINKNNERFHKDHS